MTSKFRKELKMVVEKEKEEVFVIFTQEERKRKEPAKEIKVEHGNE